MSCYSFYKYKCLYFFRFYIREQLSSRILFLMIVFKKKARLKLEVSFYVVKLNHIFRYITLRCLSSGFSQQKTSFNSLIGWTTVSKVVVETCSTLCKPPVSLYLWPSNTSDEWKKVSDKNVNNVKQARRNQCSRRQTYCSGFFQRFRNPWLWLQKFL